MNMGGRQRPATGSESFADDRRAAVQALLNRPFIQRQRDTDLYLIIRDHFRVLRDWFYEQTGWTLILTRQFAKLEKTPGRWQPWMAAAGFRDGRDYGYFTYGLWYLESLNDGQQFLLSEMVDAIREHLVTDGVSVDWTLYDHRLSMARALRKLRDLDALQAVEGDETDWARSGSGTGVDVLYQASALARHVLQQLPADVFDDGVTAAQTESETADAGADPVMQRRHLVMRRLLQEPVVYDWQWNEDERRYVQTQRASLIDRIRTFTGLEGRRFREALLFVWPASTAEMDLFPTQGMQSDILILLAGEVRRKLDSDELRYERDEHHSLLLMQSEWEALMVELRSRYGEWWSKEYREMQTVALASDIVDHLAEWNLGESLESGGVRLFPALLRWVGSYRWEGGDGA